MRRSPSSRTPLLSLLALLVGLGGGCTALAPRVDRPAIGGPQAACDPHFPDRAGWYGADAAYSIPLPSRGGRESVWLFGDSFVRRPGQGDGRAYPFIHNSVGRSICAPGGRFRLETFWRVDAAGAPHAFFEPDPGAAWVRQARATAPAAADAAYYWPLDGFVDAGVLYVALLRVVHGDPNGPFNLPFRLAGVDLARIPNPADPPPDWRIAVATLSDSREAFPGSAFVVRDGHVHAFAFVSGGGDGDGSGDAAPVGSPRILTRLPTNALAEWPPDLEASIETLDGSGRWTAGLHPDRAAILMDDPASEMSVHYEPASASWVAVYSELGPRVDGEPIAIRTRRARALRGPWSAPVDLVLVPETRGDHPRRDDPNLFCYAGKAHPQFSTASALAVTYVCNLYNLQARDPARALAVLERLRASPDLYRPRLLRVPREP